jgi:succinate dehydrogenase/fumarate reductase flavoprotein subunit
MCVCPNMIGTPLPTIPADLGEASIANIDNILHSKGSTPTAVVRGNMQRVMQSYCAVFREKKTLDKGVDEIERVHKTMDDIKVSDKSLIWNSDLVEVSFFT